MVDGSGFMGIAFEHSYGDGTNWGRFIKESMDDAAGKPGALPQLPTHPASAGAAPEEVELALNAEITAAVAAAGVNYSKLQAEMQLEFLNFDAFGKNEIKTWNCSPDAGTLLPSLEKAYHSDTCGYGGQRRSCPRMHPGDVRCDMSARRVAGVLRLYERNE